MEVDAQNPTQPYTILRIKRKRHEEPLDALVIESGIRRKKSRGGMGVFKFAQTVEDDAWNDQRLHQQIQVKYLVSLVSLLSFAQDEVSRLSREPPAVAPEVHQKTVPQPPAAPTSSRRLSTDFNRRYTIVDQERETILPTSPPEVISTKELPPKQTNPNFRVFDAIPEDNPSSHEMDRQLEKIMPMLKAYLNGASLDTFSCFLRLNFSLVDDAAASEPAPESSDYVWDVFYHRPSTLSEWNEAAAVGTLTGLPPSLTDPYDSDSDSEIEDEADEDSNAEEYYKNDYPDEEELSDWSGSGDEFHEHSDHEDFYRYDSE
ncbi:uncharacterized protein EV420DRAFT_1303814 [Desarmillaria tabescens]|uniref:Probable RNA polymerase II nuclear localization protein SLC7A6OS n=1 Tax=Armillaria tabescens TaxID=1929756 RepID=A0AA39NE30_ARMTA|nr:uncharacterized protein EV420DRAFT_1303814 [Desarmillaria tabescens]KAK0463951.1 hypothetical protein EV420DRAFT_1303814 [Desarmillaria tabescens]